MCWWIIFAFVTNADAAAVSSPSQACDGTPLLLEATSGSFSSPNYPNNYGYNANCSWRITVPEGFRVQLKFDTFRIDDYCIFDRVEILDGPNSNSPWIGRYCGRTKPRTLNSDGRSLFVKFQSDSFRSSMGFMARFVAIPAKGTRNSGTKVELRSEACRDKSKQGPGCGWAFIRVNGVDRSVHGKGINFVVLERNGRFVRATSFNTADSANATAEMKNFVDNVVLDNQIVLAAVQDNGWDHYGVPGYFVMLSLGAKEPGLGQHSSYTLIGYKGNPKPNWVKDYGRPVTRGPTVLRETIPYSDSA